MCVCVYVWRPAAGPTQAITPKFGMGSSFHPGSAPSQGATPSEKPWRVKNWAGASKQKLLLGLGLCIKNLFVGAHPNPKPAGSLDQSARDYFTIKNMHKKIKIE